VLSSRTVTAIVGLVVSVLVSVAVWWRFDTLFLFLFVPFVPLLLRRGRAEPRDRSALECPTCGFRTADPAFEFCPRDGSRLE